MAKASIILKAQWGEPFTVRLRRYIIALLSNNLTVITSAIESQILKSDRLTVYVSLAIY